MKHRYSTISILYNPNSTGKSDEKARTLARDLRKAMPDVKLRLRATKRRGHAEAMTYRTALTSRHPLVISVSGDGGYNEVVNGAIRAQRLGRTITVGLVPAGNANDHYANRHRGDFVKRVMEADEDRIDLIRLKTRRLTRYGHSYIGLGLTPLASEKLNKSKLNLWQEIKIVTSVLLHLKSIKIIVDGHVRSYDSLIFSNVGRMSKVLRVPDHTDDDGKVEVSHLYNRNKLKLIASLVQAAVLGLAADDKVSEYKFRTIKQTSVQIDGELIKIGADVDTHISVVPHTLRSIV